MKKIYFLTLLAAITIVGKSHAQEHLVATLDHEGTVSVFTGKDAFINAHEAAIDGDVITLSSGEFNATEITKAISLYGAGVLPYENATHLITRDSLKIAIPLDSTKKLMVEGIRFPFTTTFSLNYALFKKCTLENNLNYRGGEYGAEFIHCRFDYNLYNIAGHAILINCIVHGLYNYYKDSTSYDCYNCFIWPGYKGYPTNAHQLFRSTFTNCILYSYNTIYELSSDNSLISCLISTGSMDRYITIEKNSLMYYNNSDSIFSTYKTDNGGSFGRTESFQLTNNAKKSFLGNDGTEVGIYGGAMPYDPTPSVPRIKSFRMDAKPSEGILKADIEVE